MGMTAGELSERMSSAELTERIALNVVRARELEKARRRKRG